MTDVRKVAKLRVFISYSRTDEFFADELKFGLEDRGYPVEIDKQSIRYGEEWKARLSKLIADCDTVVFVLSPDSARSSVCHWEVEEAHQQAKRIIPVLYRGLREPTLGRQPDGNPWPLGEPKAPEQLTLLNYPRFDEGRSFQLGLRGIAQALEDDHEWIDAHSRLATRARDWDEGGRATNRLMYGGDITAAKRLIETRKINAPAMLPVQLDFIQASDANETTQASAREKELKERHRLTEEALEHSRKAVRRTRLGLAATTILTLMVAGAGGYAWLQRQDAVREAKRAGRSETVAAATTREAQITQSGLLSLAARTISGQPGYGDAPLAMLLAIEGVPDGESDDMRQVGRPPVAEAQDQLDSAVRNTNELAVLAHNGVVWAVAWSPDGRLLATGSGGAFGGKGEARIVEAASGKEIARIVHGGEVNSVTWSPDGKLLATGSGEYTEIGEARLIEAASGKDVARIVHNGEVSSVAWSPDGKMLATASEDLFRGDARIFEAGTGKELRRITQFFGMRVVAWSPDGRLLATGSGQLGNNGKTCIVEVATGKEVACVSHDAAVNTVAWSADAKMLATGLETFGKLGDAQIIDAVSGKEVARVTHGGDVNAVRWSPDGRLLATGSNDGTARIIEAASGKEVARVAHDRAVLAVAWSPNDAAVGPSLFTGSGDRTGRLWRVFVDSQMLVDAAKRLAARCLTPKQRAQYFLPPAPPTWCVARRLWPYNGDDWQVWLPLQKAWLASSRQSLPPPLPKSD